MPTVGEDVLNRNRPAQEQVSRYYSELWDEYARPWASGVPDTAMHMGYFDDEHTEFGPAIRNMKRILVDAVDIGPDDRVLDSGCGMGETSTWIAKECGAEVVGININEQQLERAREMAEERGVADRVDFRYDDYTEMDTLADDSVDVVWGLESICYAPDKRDVLEQAKRVLDDDGRIMVADWFMAQRKITEEERKMVEHWLQGWKMPSIPHVEDFEAELEDLGFRDVDTREALENIRPSGSGFNCRTRRMVTYPLARVMNAIGLAGDYHLEHERGCYYQHKVYDEGLATYGIVTARR